jgi:hypothetical protein
MNTRVNFLRALGLLVAVALSAPSHAVVDNWRFNLALTNGLVLSDGSTVSGASNATGVDHLGVRGDATVTQTVVGGVALGQPFVDSGFLALTEKAPEGGGIATPLDYGVANGGVNNLVDATVFGYIEYLGLTGVLNADGSITFDPGSGIVKLWLENDGDGDSTTGGVFELAEYELIAPSGGSNLDFFGGTAANSTIDITAIVTSTFNAGLFASAANVPLTTLALHLVNTDSLLDPNFSPNPDNTGIDGNGNGVSIIHVQNAGQYNLAVPEPGSLALLGLALLGLGFARGRRS